MLNNIITEWKTRVGLIERVIFEKLIGTFIEPTDERSTHMYYIYGVDAHHLVSLAIELFETTSKMRVSHINFSNLENYREVDTEIAIKKFPKHLHKLFKTVLNLTE